MLNGTIKIIAIILGVLWTVAAIPPVINTYYYIDDLTCTDSGCENYSIWDSEAEEMMLLQDEIPRLTRGLDTCNALVIDNIKK